ncbi:hypothetical protein AB837_00518 [bacterium AB1]|nr:hypothetical protein AB837_00518 [bacterium AB1]
MKVNLKIYEDVKCILLDRFEKSKNFIQRIKGIHMRMPLSSKKKYSNIETNINQNIKLLEKSMEFADSLITKDLDDIKISEEDEELLINFNDYQKNLFSKQISSCCSAYAYRVRDLHICISNSLSKVVPSFYHKEKPTDLCVMEHFNSVLQKALLDINNGEDIFHLSKTRIYSNCKRILQLYKSE